MAEKEIVNDRHKILSTKEDEDYDRAKEVKAFDETKAGVQDHWVDVPPIEGALIVNIGDLLQLISNDKFKSVEHRVVAKSVGPRISLACLFTTFWQPSNKVYGPLKELLSPHSPPLYKETSIVNYLKSFVSVGGLANALSFHKL